MCDVFVYEIRVNTPTQRQSSLPDHMMREREREMLPRFIVLIVVVVVVVYNNIMENA